MTVIAFHVNGEPLARLEIDPASIEATMKAPDFPVADRFQGVLSDLPGVPVNEGIFIGTLFDSRLRGGGEEELILTISCGTTESFEIRHREIDGRRQPVAIRHGEERPADSFRLIDALTETQRHFATRVPRVPA